MAAAAQQLTSLPTTTPRPRELLLLGGGHAHVEVLRRLPSFDARLRITLIAKEPLAPYSGMLPGVVSGAYTSREAHIDLKALAGATGGGGEEGRCRVVEGEAKAVDVPGRRVLVKRTRRRRRGGPEEDSEEDSVVWMPYDLLSINVGAATGGPPAESSGGGLAAVTPVKPIASFLARWEGDVLPLARRHLEKRAEREADDDDDEATPAFSVAVVGGGAGGVELAFAVAQRLGREWRKAWRRSQKKENKRRRAAPLPPPPPTPALVTLFSRGKILPGAPAQARLAFLRLASAPGSLVRIREHAAPAPASCSSSSAAVDGAAGPPLLLTIAGGGNERFDACLWCTRAAAPAWFAKAPSAGLPLDARGFLRTRATLQLASEGDGDGDGSDDVFAAGDAATIDGCPRPKAGVYAVRAGPFLAENLRRRAQWLADSAAEAATLRTPPPSLLEFRPQSRALALISAGEGYAVASRPPFPFCPAGAWAWAWKDRVDRAFVRRYDQTGEGALAAAAAAAAAAQEEDDENDDD